VRNTVVALDKIGLPLAVQFPSTGHKVIGVGVDPMAVELVDCAWEPFPDEAHLAERLPELVPSGNLRMTPIRVGDLPAVTVVVDGRDVTDVGGWQGAM
jgi:UDP-N-acetyl-D-glucosamine dehydrogenase